MAEPSRETPAETTVAGSPASNRTSIPSTSAEASGLYDASYYQHSCGDEPYGRTPSWLGLFGITADRLVQHLHPRTSLDVGCAFGLLVESLRDRGVDARGIDLSPYAISQVREDVQPYCRVGSVTDPLGGPYDLVTCIEVLEHLPPAEEQTALDRLTEAAPVLLISSSPDNFEEATHFNVQPIRHWLGEFAKRGFYPDPYFDASFLAPQAVLLRKGQPQPEDLVAAMGDVLAFRCRVASAGQSPLGALAATDAGTQDPALLAFRLKVAEERIRVMEAGIGWRLLSGYRRFLQESIRSRPWLARIYEPLANAGVRLAGGATIAEPEAEHAPPPHPILSHAVHGGDLVLCCETPGADGTTVAASALIVSGWAVDREGIRAIRIKGLPIPEDRVVYGLPSPDIAAYLPEYANSANARFLLKVPTVDWPEGSYQIEIEAENTRGRRTLVTRTATIWNCTPYEFWIKNREPQLRLSDAQVPTTGPLISIVTPLYGTPLSLLEKCVASVEAQRYPNWELCLVDDASGDPALRQRLAELAAHPRIKVKELAENQGIAGATNEAIAMATGDFIAFLDHDDELAPDTLAEVVRALLAEDPPDVIYTDEDKITEEGHRFEPFFKPSFSPDFLRSGNYVCHFLVVRGDLLRDVGGLRRGFDGSQDFDLVLRLSERTSAIHRIPRILYHWRATQGSTAAHVHAKPQASENGRRALEQHLQRFHPGAKATIESPGRYRAHYPLTHPPEVAIILPTGGNMEMLSRTVRSVLKDTRYKPFRVLVADNSKGEDVTAFVGSLNDPLVQTVDFRAEPFNFSGICNRVAASCTEPMLLFLNDDMEVLNPEWLRTLVELGNLPNIGAVGAKLLYPDGTIQHAGVTMSTSGVARHAFREIDPKSDPYFGFTTVIRNCAAVTGACLLTRREVFEAIGGFNATDFPVDYQDVEYCLRVWERGLRVVYTPFAQLTHYESASRGKAMPPERERQAEIMRQRWASWIADDPFYNPNLTRNADDFSLDPEDFRNRESISRAKRDHGAQRAQRT